MLGLWLMLFPIRNVCLCHSYGIRFILRETCTQHGRCNAVSQIFSATHTFFFRISIQLFTSQMTSNYITKIWRCKAISLSKNSCLWPNIFTHLTKNLNKNEIKCCLLAWKNKKYTVILKNELLWQPYQTFRLGQINIPTSLILRIQYR